MKSLGRHLVSILITLVLLGLSIWSGCTTSLINSMTAHLSDLPRYTRLPLFDPHRKTFTCVYQAQHLPPIDPQAELWYEQALTLNDPNIWYEDRDWKKIYQLYVQAAERNHWKAMLNLASLILSSYPIPEHDPEVAIRWVEKAMKLGVPDAWDRMGVYHQNGLIKGGDATSAYAFFQKAADMGSPVAMAFLGEKLDATYDDPEGEFWGNLSVGTAMLECAFAQGDGDAAEELGYIYARPETPVAKLRALHVLHEGVKLGSAECAKKLSIEFDGFNLTHGRNLPGHIDKARAERYGKIGDALEFWQGRLKLPNLDKILPLPPAPLPRWDGNVQTLIDAAKAVTPAPAKPASAMSLQGRAAMPEGQGVLPLAQSPYAVPGDQPAPESGYWLALYGLPSMSKAQLRFARDGLPERYRAGEPFDPPAGEWLTPEQVQWHFLGQPRQLPPPRETYLALKVQIGLLRQIPPPEPAPPCNGLQPCPQTGIWEARVADDHPLAALYNQWDRQAFVVQGRAFPDPRERFLDIAPQELQWAYLGSPNADTKVPRLQEIAL